MDKFTWRALCPKCCERLSKTVYVYSAPPNPLPWPCDNCGNPLQEADMHLFEKIGGMELPVEDGP